MHNKASSHLTLHGYLYIFTSATVIAGTGGIEVGAGTEGVAVVGAAAWTQRRVAEARLDSCGAGTGRVEVDAYPLHCIGHYLHTSYRLHTSHRQRSIRQRQ